MLKQFVFILAFLISASVITFAQDNTEKKSEDTHHKIEMNKIQKVDDNKETEAKQPWNKVCPVKGNPVEEGTATVEFNGKVYGFCCPGCDLKFAKNPEKYAKNLSEDGKRFIGKK